MKKHSISLAALAVAIAFVGSAASTAGNAADAVQTANYGNAYVGVGAGVLIPQSTSWTMSGSVTGSGTINYNDGAAIIGMAGYHFNDYLASEAELGYSSFDYSNLSGTLTAGSTTASGSIGINGSVDAVIGLANGIVTPWGNKGFSPYIGGGLGFANYNTKVNSLTVGTTTVGVNSSNNATDLALDAIVGLNYAVTDKFSIGGRYQYLWFDSSSTTTTGSLTVNEGNFGASIITAQLTYNF